MVAGLTSKVLPDLRWYSLITSWCRSSIASMTSRGTILHRRLPSTIPPRYLLLDHLSNTSSRWHMEECNKTITSNWFWRAVATLLSSLSPLHPIGTTTANLSWPAQTVISNHCRQDMHQFTHKQHESTWTLSGHHLHRIGTITIHRFKTLPAKAQARASFTSWQHQAAIKTIRRPKLKSGNHLSKTCTQEQV